MWIKSPDNRFLIFVVCVLTVNVDYSCSQVNFKFNSLLEFKMIEFYRKTVAVLRKQVFFGE